MQDGEDREPIGEAVLEAERFPQCAELYLAQYVLAQALRSGGNGRTMSQSGEPGPSVWTGP